MRIATPDASGWFGKLACTGDFAHRRLPVAVVSACDTWLSLGMLSVRDDSDWLVRYLSASAWSFIWSPGVVDERWWCGIMMPSVDNVGRYFPLLVMQATQQSPSRESMTALDDWYEGILAVASATFHQSATVDSFEDSLARVPHWSTMPTDGSACNAPNPVVERWKRGNTARASSWSQAATSSRVDRPVWIFDGLPGETDLASMLTDQADMGAKR